MCHLEGEIIPLIKNLFHTKRWIGKKDNIERDKEERNEPSKSQCETKNGSACRYFDLVCPKKGKKKDKKRWLCTNNKPTEEIIEKDQPPEDELELRFLFLSHVKGLIRGNAPVRIRVSMDRVDALLAFVRASAGLSLPDSRTTFCKV